MLKQSFFSILLIFQMQTFTFALNETDSMIFLSKSKPCPMYTKSCRVPILIQKNINSANDLLLISNSTKFFRFIKIESCNVANNKFLTNTECDVSGLQTNFALKDNFTLVYGVFEPIIVGKGSYVIQYNTSSDKIEYYQNDLIISQPQRLVDNIYQMSVFILTVIISVFMGLLLDTNTLIKIIKMPIPVLIGFLCQYLCMPLLAFACTKIFSFTPVEALGLFIYGCSPGGSHSNHWALMFNGDIDLSAIMTFVSTMASLICMPAWLYTLGRVLTQEAKITIPFLGLLMNLCITIAPCLFGLLLSKCFPKLKKNLLKIIKPTLVLLLLTFLGFMLYVKFYVFTLVNWQQWLTAPFLPWLGFLIGGLIAWLFKQPKQYVITVALETGIQNAGIAFLIIVYNFPSPESDYAILPILSVSILTTIPFWPVLLILTIKQKFCTKEKNAAKDDLNKEERKMEPLLENKDDY